MDPWFLALLQCPISKTPLCLADPSVLADVNQAIREGRLENRNLDPVANLLDGGLVSEDGSFLYPVYGQTPHLMAGDAIDLRQFHSPSKGPVQA